MKPDIQFYWFSKPVHNAASTRALYSKSNSEAIWQRGGGYSSTRSTSLWLEVSDWSVSLPGSFIPREKAPDFHLTGDRMRPRNNITLAVNQTTIPRTSNPQPIHYST